MAWELFHNPPTSLSPVRVIRVAPTASKASPNVRYAFNGDRICASQRTDTMCQEATYAVRQVLLPFPGRRTGNTEPLPGSL